MMDLWWQYAVVAAVVLASGGWLAARAWKFFTAKRVGGCGSCSGGCGAADAKPLVSAVSLPQARRPK